MPPPPPRPPPPSSRAPSSPSTARSRTFRLDDSERGIKRIRVTRNTRFERIDGFAGLRAGMTNIETIVKRRDGRWVAIEVERSGGGGNHGGDDD